MRPRPQSNKDHPSRWQGPSEAGLSLVELLISAGLLAFISLATVKFMQYQNTLETKANAQIAADRAAETLLSRLQRDFEGRHRKAISEDGFSLVPASALSALHVDFPEASQRAAAAAAGIPVYSYQTKCRNVTASDTPFHVFIRSLISWQLSPKQVLKPSATATAGRSGDCLVQRNCPIGQIPYVERTEFLSNGTRRVIEFPNLAELRALGRSQIIGQCLKVTKLSELASIHFQLDVMSYVGELGEGCSALGGKSACFQVQTRELSFSLKNAAGIVILPK